MVGIEGVMKKRKGFGHLTRVYNRGMNGGAASQFGLTMAVASSRRR